VIPANEWARNVPTNVDSDEQCIPLIERIQRDAQAELKAKLAEVEADVRTVQQEKDALRLALAELLAISDSPNAYSDLLAFIHTQFPATVGNIQLRNYVRSLAVNHADLKAKLAEVERQREVMRELLITIRQQVFPGLDLPAKYTVWMHDALSTPTTPPKGGAA